VFKVDLHVHTSLGGDSLIDPGALVLRAVEVGLDAVCVTEHHSYFASQPFDEIALETGFPVLRGMEYTAYEGHLLLFGVRAGRGDLPPRMPAQKVVDWACERGGVAIAAHPYQRGIVGGALGDRVLALERVAAIEGINASAAPEDNRRAAQAAEQMGLPSTGGSDAHGLHVLGRAYTLFPEPVRTEAELLRALKAGECCARWNGSYPEPRPAVARPGQT
jgi:predicted metal-dependent phosphoesterase TrpH